MPQSKENMICQMTLSQLSVVLIVSRLKPCIFSMVFWLGKVLFSVLCVFVLLYTVTVNAKSLPLPPMAAGIVLTAVCLWISDNPKKLWMDFHEIWRVDAL